jgi:hypothetical protein
MGADSIYASHRSVTAWQAQLLGGFALNWLVTGPAAAEAHTAAALSSAASRHLPALPKTVSPGRPPPDAVMKLRPTSYWLCHKDIKKATSDFTKIEAGLTPIQNSGISTLRLELEKIEGRIDQLLPGAPKTLNYKQVLLRQHRATQAALADQEELLKDEKKRMALRGDELKVKLLRTAFLLWSFLAVVGVICVGVARFFVEGLPGADGRFVGIAAIAVGCSLMCVTMTLVCQLNFLDPAIGATGA